MKLAVFATILLASYPADSREEMELVLPPAQRNCMGAPMAWAKVTACFDRFAPTQWNSLPAAAHAHVIRYAAQRFVYVEFAANQWHMVRAFGDEAFEVVPHADPRGFAQRHFDVWASSMLDRQMERTTRVELVCPLDQQFCHVIQTRCVVMDRGRAVETFIGGAVVDSAGARAEGDRSQSGPRCGS